MINKEEFEYHKYIIDWMVANGRSFSEAMAIISYADQNDLSIPIAFVNIISNDL